LALEENRLDQWQHHKILKVQIKFGIKYLTRKCLQILSLPTILASGFKFRRLIVASFTTSNALAPSFILDALAAVIVPKIN
jgi:hypothetical protein